MAQPVYRLATGWTVRGSNPGEGEIFRTRPDRPWCPPSLLYNGCTGSFPRVKRPERGLDRPIPSIAEVKERVELYLYYPSGPSWPILGWTSLSKVHRAITRARFMLYVKILNTNYERTVVGQGYYWPLSFIATHWEKSVETSEDVIKQAYFSGICMARILAKLLTVLTIVLMVSLGLQRPILVYYRETGHGNITPTSKIQ